MKAISKQPAPKAGVEEVVPRVMADVQTYVNQPMPVLIHLQASLISRQEIGLETYGTPLQSYNGRDAFADALQELLDLCNYLKQLMMESNREYTSMYFTALNLAGQMVALELEDDS